MLSPSKIIALQRLIQATTGLITAILVIHFLSPEEQGYFYTIGSLLSSYILLDLGLSSLIVQLTARDFSLTQSSENLVISVAEKPTITFSSLLSWVARWYLGLGAISFLLIPLGFLYFSSSGSHHELDWQLPWVLVISSLALSMPAVGLLAVFEGVGKIKEVYILRIMHYLIGASLAWLLLVFGHGLYALSMAPLATAIVVYCWLWHKFRPLLRTSFTGKEHFDWKQEILPQQKKVGLSWLSNYLFLHTPVPIVFYLSGSVIAGKIGLSMVIANVSCAIALSSVTAVTPKISNLIGSGEAIAARTLFINAFAKSVGLLLLGIMTFYLLQLTFMEASVMERVLPPLQMLFIFVSVAAFHTINAVMVYFRAYRLEPMTLPNIVASLVVSVVGYWTVSYHGVNAFILLMASSYLSVLVYALLSLRKFKYQSA